jgi:hypothetical protein
MATLRVAAIASFRSGRVPLQNLEPTQLAHDLMIQDRCIQYRCCGSCHQDDIFPASYQASVLVSRAGCEIARPWSTTASGW